MPKVPETTRLQRFKSEFSDLERNLRSEVLRENEFGPS